ncbi:FadR/GntR family transcriptional regulator [Kribbella sp. CA-245084]|uniref:FadR/GntR family transcriptional regulator n=1 Tax=Kribbella sp. CA-245084 TaxID=3239940 RepID=UPI003D92118C
MRGREVAHPGRHHDRVVEEVGRAIVTGRYREGESVSPERLAEDFGVSRPVIREAFRALQGKGLLVARPKVGTRVSDPRTWNYLDPQIITWRLESDRRTEQVDELYSVRLAVEPVAARMAALRAKPADLAQLTRAIDTMYAALDQRDLHTFVSADVDFHVTLLDLSGSKMFDCLGSVIETAVRTRETLVFPVVEAMRRGLELHRQLVQDIMTGSPDLETTSRRLIVDAHDEANIALGVWGSGTVDDVPSQL